MVDPVDDDEPLAPAPAPAETRTTDASTPEGVTRQRRKVAKEDRDTAEFLQVLLGDPRGRAFLWTILSLAGTFETRAGIAADGSHDPYLTGFNRGQFAIGQHFYLDWLRLDPEGTALMLTEHHPQIVGKPKPARAPRR